MPADPALITLAIDGLDAVVHAVHMEGHEGISELFEFRVIIRTDAADLDLASVVGKKAKLGIVAYEDDEPRLVHGIVSRIEQTTAEIVHAASYEVTLVPRAWLLQHRTDNRIFQEKTAPEVIKAVFEGAGLASGDDFKLSLQATYAKREYCVQYGESDWDFACRLMEEEGVYYHFEQSDDGHVLVLVDRASAASPIAGNANVKFRQPQGALAAAVHGAHVTRFVCSEEVRPGKVTLRDWNFEKPALELESAQEGATGKDLAVYDYPGDFSVPGDGDAWAKVRVAELQASRKRGGGDGTCAHFLPGHTFHLEEHPHDALNAQYLLVRVEHTATDLRATASTELQAAGGPGVQGSSYRNHFELVPASVQFRPPRVTRRPRIPGVQTAIVVGSSGEEIFTDKYGRVKVQFHWDRLGKNDDKSSCWVRVAQMWASAGFGAMFLPRVGDEVVVSFLEGDPDRPLVVGSVYHATNVVPYTLPDEKTKSTIKTKSTPNGDNGDFNELRFEDKKGSEEVFLQAQKDWNVKVKNDETRSVGHDETLTVENDRTKTVKHDQKATIENDDTLTVKHDQSVTIENDQTVEVKNDRKVTVDNDDAETVKGKQTIEVDGDQKVSVSGEQKISVSGSRSLSVDEDVKDSFKGKLSLSVTGDVSETLSGKHTTSVSGDRSESIGGKQSITISGDSVESVTGKKSMTVTGEVTITSGSSKVTIKPSGEITIQGVQVKVDAQGPLQVHGATVDVKSDGPATIKAPIVNVNADGVNTIKGAMIVLDGQAVSVG